jgi:acyl-[acyl-carrier-protein]-phospholipid O-acyltransferase/long-chain-fatty-acid--[acyl-carrier-protein] ligase
MHLPPLLKSRRFLPLFVTQFLGAFNDNLFKNALAALITFRIAAETHENANFLVTLAGAIFILPFFLFSATAGQLADKYDKSTLARITKIWEIGILFIASIGFYLGSPWFLQFVLFCLGVQATFFGPIKYALLPQHLREEELIEGNAYIEAGTFLAILLGTIAGELLILRSGGIAIVSAGMMLCAVAGYFSSRSIPAAPAPVPDLVIGRNIWRETWKIVGISRKRRDVFLSILGNSWFWFVGATFMSQFFNYAKDVMHADETVVTLFLTMFSLGIGLGSFLCNKMLKGQVQATYTPPAALGMSIFMVDLYFASGHAPQPAVDTIMNAATFVGFAASWRILFDLLMIAVCAGVYIVPLYAIMQERSAPEERARAIAASNIINALFMVSSAIMTILLLKLSFSIPQIFLTMGLLNGFVAIYICKLLPDALIRTVMQFIFKRLYRVEVRGLENYAAAGERVLLVANHTSFLDAALIASYLPEKITFAINTHIARLWWMKPFLALVDAFPLDPTNPLATKSLIDVVKKGRKCMIFPEGRITVTGSLMKIYEGPGMIAEKAGAQVLPIRIDGAQYSPFSRLQGKVRTRWFPKVTLTILPPRTFYVPAALKGRKRRQAAGAQLYDVMSKMMFESSHIHETLFEALVTAQDIHGHAHLIAEDIERKPLSYGQFIMRSFLLGKVFDGLCPNQRSVGVLLPSAVSTALVFFGLQAYGRAAAMLNFTAGATQMVGACKTAGVRTVLTSRRFVKLGKLENVVEELARAGVSVTYLEDLREKIGTGAKIGAFIAAAFPRTTLRRTLKTTPDDPAVILFTSGSEGTPKGVVLSHTNFQANRFQLSARVDFGPQDKVFNCLPMFHAFGLTGGTLLPVLSGIKTFFYPSPLHYRIVPELIYDTNATILFGTDTFLSGYARMAHPYDLHSVRYVFAGAEKLKEETRRVYAEKFGVRIFEGYGATETAPVLSTNTPMQNRTGTVGRFMPAIDCKLEPVPGIDEGGKLWVKGPNIMMGYFRAENPAVLEPPKDGWYDTGDIVAIDAEGFITIMGRTKRFAKIGGEMISLAAVEAAVSEIWPGHQHAAVTVPDPKKGEQITLLTDNTEATREALHAYFREAGMPELALPRRVLVVKQVPLLGTGKIDYQTVKAIALEEEKSQRSFFVGSPA